MRKDLKAGLGIGGVLLAVLLVAAIVRSHNRHNKLVAANDAARTDGDGGTGTPQDGATPPTVSPDPPTAPPTSPRTGAGSSIFDNPPSTTPVPGSSDGGTESSRPVDPAPPAPRRAKNWDEMFSSGRVDPPSLVSLEGGGHTPPNTGRNLERPGDHAVDRTESHMVDPGPKTPGTFTHPTEVKPSTPRTYTVAQGETFSSIAKAVYGNQKYYLDIQDANPDVNPNRLRLNQTINLPTIAPAADRHSAHHGEISSSSSPSGSTHHPAGDSTREYTVEPGDSLYRISTKLYGTARKVDAIYELNKDRIGPNRERLKLGMTLKLPEPPTVASR